MRREKKNFIAALDIGTSKVCVILGTITENGVEVLGLSTTSSRGVTKGVITDINRASAQIKAAIKAAQLEAGRKIDKLWVGIAGSHIQGKDNQSFVPVKGVEQIITQKDIEEALKKASSVALPKDRETIHVLPQEYVVDGQNQIEKPVGMRGANLQLRTYIITASAGCSYNIEDSVRGAGYQIEGLALQPLASGLSTLSEEEQNLGVALLDIGGGTTDVAIFLKEGLRFTKVISVGGNHITNDIAVGLHTSAQEAEKTKLRYGTASLKNLHKNDYLEVEGVSGRGKYRIKRATLTRIIELRVEELLELVDVELKSSGYKGLITAGVVITGGSSLLPEIKGKTEEKLGLPARVGYPQMNSSAGNLSPIHATGVGLLLWGAQVRKELAPKQRLNVKVKQWLKDFF